MIPIADPNFAEASWILVVKSIVIFGVVMAIVPLLTVGLLSIMCWSYPQLPAACNRQALHLLTRIGRPPSSAT